MSPIKLLAEGIKDNDWPTVVAAYRSLTGDESIVAPANNGSGADLKTVVEIVRTACNNVLDEVLGSKPGTTLFVEQHKEDDDENEKLEIDDSKKFITAASNPEQKALNEKIAKQKAKMGNKRGRKPGKRKCKTICSHCKEEFKSDVNVGSGKEIGTMCKKCLSGKRKN
jgi:hypothetical protein